MGILIRNLDKAKVGDVGLSRRQTTCGIKTKKPKRKLISHFSANSGQVAIILLEDRKKTVVCLPKITGMSTTVDLKLPVS